MSVALSVVTVTRGRHDLLRRKADALAAQTLPPERFEWRVLVNDDPGAAVLLRGLELPYALHLEETQAVLPAAVGRNRAARGAVGEVLLLSDDDVLLPPGCLAAHVGAHAGSARRVVIGPLRLPDDLRQESEREPFERTVSVFGRGLWINATGANTSLPRAAFEAAGGYDERYLAYGGEDADLALRLKRTGMTFLRSVAAWAYHVGRVLPDTGKAYQAGKAHVRVWRRHGGTDVGLLLGVLPATLPWKRALLRSPLRRLLSPAHAAYEEAFVRGASDALRADPEGSIHP